MNLSQAQGSQDDELILSWNKYIDESGDFTPSTYDIYRGVDITNMALEYQLTGTLSSYNYNALSVVDGEHFIVIVDMPSCSPLYNSNKASGGPYYQSSSNIEDEGIIATGMKSITAEQLEIFPNPMREFTLIKSDVKIERIQLYNITGELIRIISDINANEYKMHRDNLSVGTYIIKINNSSHRRLIVK